MSALPRSRPAVDRVNPAITQFVFAFLLVGLLAVVNYGSNIHDHASFTTLAQELIPFLKMQKCHCQPPSFSQHLHLTRVTS